MKIKLLNYIELIHKKINKEINDLKNKINDTAKNDSIILIDKATGFEHELFIEDGELKIVANPKVELILPKTEYVDGDSIDFTGSQLKYIYSNGDEEIVDIENTSTLISVPPTLSLGMTSVKVIYQDEVFVIDGITVSEFDAASVLIDFNYIDNNNGTYTIASWKGTYNGVASTEIIVPNNNNIIL